jgi:hypothetical protein
MIASVVGAFAATAEVKRVTAAADGNKVDIDIELTSPVTPKIGTAQQPDRLIVDFADASPREVLQHIQINENGIKRVRVGLNHANPPLTRVVVDLDYPHAYSVERIGNRVLLHVFPIVGTRRSAAADAPKKPNLDPSVPEVTVKAQAPVVRPQTVEVPAAVASEQAQTSVAVRHSFRVRYIAGNSAYIDGGSNAGLREGMTLVVHDFDPFSPNRSSSAKAVVIADVRVVAVASNSAVTEVRTARRKLKVGDWASLTVDGAESVAAGKVLAVAAKPEPNDLELRSETPTSKLETVERSRVEGRFGFDYSGISSSGSTPGTSTQVGLSFQSDMTHILGTHWNLQGYWRGRITRHSQFQQDTIEETLNKTYTMQLYYDNPDSKWVAGFGRLYLPWAVSLDTIDGGYVGRKVHSGVIVGGFFGSTPDLTTWDYTPSHRIGGSFVNFEGGNLDSFHYTSTSGIALSTIDWKFDKPYLFFENEVSYRGKFSIYHSLTADFPSGLTTNGIKPGPGISHSYLTVHYQPNRKVSLDVYHNYFRDVPTAATQIVGTGLVDKLLFQGVSAGVHYKPFRNLTLYTTLGTSEKTGDERRTLNQMYGATWNEIAHTGIRTDAHYSKFDSNFAVGDYRVLSFSRQVGDHMFWNLQLGDQNMISALTANDNSKFVANSLDINLGKRMYLQTGYTFVDGAALNYRQWYTSLGYRFDQKQEAVEIVPNKDSQ